MAAFTCHDGRLLADQAVVLDDLPAGIDTVPDVLGNGVFLRGQAPQHESAHRFGLGRVAESRRWVCCHRCEPYWVVPATGIDPGGVPIETQFLLVERRDGQCVVVMPVLDGWFRSCLEGDGEGGLIAVAESGDPDTVGRDVITAYVTVGHNPYWLMAGAARSVVHRFRGCRLRIDKVLPRFADVFGWCTWNAFYGEVSHAKVVAGLESFRASGVMPRFVVLDDGWLSQTATAPGESRRLTSFAANDKFPGDLQETVAIAKGRFGILHFLVWHAFNGYWDGVDAGSLSDYSVRDCERQFGPGVRHYYDQDKPPFWAEGPLGLVPPEAVDRFFNDFHRRLMEQGVDGVKVDSQATVEALGEGCGGRVELMRRYREALEGSVFTHFMGNLINCMSCSNDMVYTALAGNITRTSTDFWPKRPETHGPHVYTNAVASFWLGEFVHPDWDMFESGHEAGHFHAAARAVGGCPIYVADAPGEHDAELLRKLVLDDGRILRALDPGRPTRDCLFVDPLTEEVLYKIFNRNPCGGVVGVFNCQNHPDPDDRRIIEGEVRPSDVVDLVGKRFAVYAHNTGELREVADDEAVTVCLQDLGFEIYTIVPVAGPLTPIGLADKFNSGAAVRRVVEHLGCILVDLLDGGEFVAWCPVRPGWLRVDGVDLDFIWVDGKLSASLPTGRELTIEAVFPAD